MLKNYLITAWRNLQRNRIISLINIAGLSFGIAACLLIAIYIIHESSYDSQIPVAKHIFRLVGTYQVDGTIKKGAHFSANTSTTIESDFSEVIESARIMDNPLFYGAGSNQWSIDNSGTKFYEEGFTYADPEILTMFQIPMVYGDNQSALALPKTILITESKSRKYFGDIDPVGNTIYLNGNYDDPFTIGGVMEDWPSNSHMDYDFLITLSDVEFGEGEQTRWLQSNYFVYLQIKEGVIWEELQKKISDDIILNYIQPAYENAGFVQAASIADDLGLLLQPLIDIHLYSADIFDAHTRGDVRFIWLFGIVAVFILLIAVINFVNLSTAKSANRAKEVGLRKVLGSGRKNLISQFLSESILTVFISVVVGLLLAAAVLPVFNHIANRQLELPFARWWFVPLMVGVVFLVGSLAGFYPSIYLSKFKPIRVLRGKISQGTESSGLRSGLVVFQFTISVILIAGTMVIHQQMNYILTKNVGFEKDQVIQLQGTDMLGEQIETFKDELMNDPAVVNVSISDYLPVEGTKRNGNSFWREGMVNVEEAVFGQAWIIDEDYIPTLGMQLVEGRNFMDDRSMERESVIINEEMARRFGWEGQALGKKLSRFNTLYNVVGVVKDFHFQSFKEEVSPLAFFAGISPTIMSVKVEGGKMPELLNKLEGKWKLMVPGVTLRYTFMDQAFANMYDFVKRTSWIFTAFAILAIFIACLGLFALSAFIVEQRSKEMSIRKVLGASVQNIFRQLSSQFIILVFIALVIAVPVSVYLMRKWLQDFAYSIDLSWGVFLLAGVISILIAITTISYHVIRTALMNPIVHLKEN